MRSGAWKRRAWMLVPLALLGTLLWATAFRRDPVPVETARAERGVVEELVTNSRAGSVRARFRTQLGSETAGRVAALPHREGAEVDSGAVLVQLDDRTARAQVALASRDLESQRARLAAAESAAELAASDAARSESLAARGAIPAEALETARARDRQAGADLRAATALAERARAALDLARTELARHAVRAPFAGVVNKLYVELGASVVPGQGLLDLMSHGDLYVSAPMDELDIGRIRAGQQARVSLDPYPGRSFDAVVSRVAPFVSELEEQNRTMEVELHVVAVPADVVFRPGTSADVEIVLQRHPDAVRIPAVALLEGERVLVVQKGRAEERRVKVGLRNWDWVEILDGLAPGDAVITSLGRSDVKPGVAVVASPAAGTGS
jgi:HlyD family secretion protein